jgi:hypothetical protein
MSHAELFGRTRLAVIKISVVTFTKIFTELGRSNHKVYAFVSLRTLRFYYYLESGRRFLALASH